MSPTRTYSAATSSNSSRAAGALTTIRSAEDCDSPWWTSRGRGLLVRNRHGTQASAIRPASARSTPPGPNATMSRPLTSGPRKTATASTAPDAALPTVSAAVEAEISGSSALWTGLVSVTLNPANAAVTATTG